MTEPRVVIVTGAGSGIGRASAERFADGGNVVLAVDRDAPALRAFEESRRGKPGAVVALAEDLVDPAAGQRIVHACLQRWSKIDVLVLVAGIGQYGPTASVSLQEWDRVIDINLRAPFLLTQAALPALVASRGCVVAISSIAGIQGWPYSAVYSASKGGLVTMMKSLAIEHGPQGVRINVICPGAVETALAAGMRAPDFRYNEDLRKRSTSLDGRKADPAEIASLIGFLAGPEASFVNGSVLRADGGAFA